LKKKKQAKIMKYREVFDEKIRKRVQIVQKSKIFSAGLRMSALLTEVVSLQ
jgi:hypothetical protein